MVRKYFLNSVNNAAVTTCSGNPFHKDTTRLQQSFLAKSSLKAFFCKFESMSSGYNMLIIISVMIR